MSLPSLPSECLAHIFSFSDYSTPANCRLANNQFNQIIRNYKIQRPRVKSVNHYYPIPDENEQLIFVAKKKKYWFEISDTQSVQDVVRNILNKIEHSDNVYFRNIDINDQFLLISHKFGDRFWYFQTTNNCKNAQYLGNRLNASFISIKNKPSLFFPPDQRTYLFSNDEYLKDFGDRIFDISLNFNGYYTGFTFGNESLERKKYPGSWYFGVFRFDNCTLGDINDFIEFYDASRYHCKHWTNSEIATVEIYSKRQRISIQFQLKPNEDDWFINSFGNQIHSPGIRNRSKSFMGQLVIYHFTMSLPLLPSECLAHIFSFSDYSTLANCRLANSQFNQIIKNYRIHRLRVKSVNILYMPQKKIIQATVIPSPDETEQLVFLSGVKKRKFNCKISDEKPVQEVLKNIMNRIEHSDNVYFCNLEITDQFLLISNKFGDRFWNCKNLVFQCCSFSLSTQYMKHLMNVIKPKRINVFNCIFHNERILSAECLSATSINIDNPSLPSLGSNTHLFLNDAYLKDFGDRIFDVSFNFDNLHTGFTFYTVRRLLNERLERRKHAGPWCFGVLNFGLWTLGDYNNFVEFYTAAGYYCQHWIGNETANAVIYINGVVASIQFQLRPTAEN